MIDSLKCILLSCSITVFANVPQIFEYPVEKITFGALLYFIIWTYMKTILPKNQADYTRVCEENRKLLNEVERTSRLLENQQRINSELLKKLEKYVPESGKSYIATMEDKISNLKDGQTLPGLETTQKITT